MAKQPTPLADVKAALLECTYHNIKLLNAQADLRKRLATLTTVEDLYAARDLDGMHNKYLPHRYHFHRLIRKLRG
jgi:hypothetical protein